MKTERTRPATAWPVPSTLIRDHLRLTADMVEDAVPFALAAARDIEAYCDIALITQTITVETAPNPDTVIDLLIGPATDDAVQTVQLVAADGTATDLDAGWFFRGGRHPKLHLLEPTDLAVRVTYTAGFGATWAAVPADLQLAIADAAAAMFDGRGVEGKPGLPVAAARLAARWRGVRA